MPTSLKQHAINGAFWSFTERFGKQGVQFIVSIVMARLLEPRDFGVVAMLSIFLALAQSVVDSGYGQALIQKQDADDIDASTVFWFNIAVGIVMAIIFFFSAPWIADFYDTPLLKPVARIFSLNLIINSLSVVQNSLLVKELAFRQRMKAIICSIIISGIVGVTLAWLGWGIWSLVAQGIVMNLVRTTGLWLVHPWRPIFVFSRKSIKDLWQFGSKLLFSGLLTRFFDNVYIVVIGKLYSADDLGFYQRGRRLILLTSHSVTQVVAQVSFPVLSKMQSDLTRMCRAFVIGLQSTIFVVVPLMVMIGTVATDLVQVLLGDRWLPTVPYLQIMCISSSFFPIHLLNLKSLLALGRSDLFLRLEIVKKVVVVLAIAATFRYGVIGLLWGQVATSVVCLVINTHYVKQNLGYGLFAQLLGVRKILLASLGMGGCVWLTRHIPIEFVPLRLATRVAIGSIVFIALETMLKEPVFFDILKVASNWIRSRDDGQA